MPGGMTRQGNTYNAYYVYFKLHKHTRSYSFAQ